MYPGVFDTLGFKGEQRTVAKETRLGTDLPETFTKANDSAAAEKKRKRNRQKKGKRELPDDAHNKWDPAMKQVVIAEVERLTTDYEEPAYTDAVNNLRTKYRAAFTEGGRDLRSQHAVRWWSKGYDGVCLSYAYCRYVPVYMLMNYFNCCIIMLHCIKNG